MDVDVDVDAEAAPPVGELTALLLLLLLTERGE